MYDKGKIIIGLIVFLAVTTFPFWYNRASGTASVYPPPKPVPQGYHCVEDLEFMRASHMQLLNEWRDKVVREGARVYESRYFQGEKYAMSLSNTCLKCHADWSGFAGGNMAIAPEDQPRTCLECHDYAGVTVYCYDCHIHPQEY